MATISIRVMQGGQPVQGATVYEGLNDLRAVTDTDGRIPKTVPAGWGPKPILLVIVGPGIPPSFQVGQTTTLLRADEELVIEV